MSETSGIAELAAAWAHARSGQPSVVRFTGDPSGALEPLRAHLVPDWSVGRVPTGEPAILWLAEGPASEAAADVCVTAVVMLRLPWLVVVSGPRAADRGVAFGLEVPGGAPGDVSPTRVAGLDVPRERQAEEVERLAADGRIVEASALLHALADHDPVRAASLRWVHLARCFFLARPDTLAVARGLLADPAPGRSRVLAFAGQAHEDGRVALHLLRQAIRDARTDDERQDALYYRNRQEVTLGQRLARDTGEPAHPLMLAMARFGPATREAFRSTEPGPAHRALDALQTSAAAALSGWVALRYDLDHGDWKQAAAGLIALGLARSAGWLLAESVQYRPQHAAYRDGLVQLDSPKMVRAVELTRLLDTFDAHRARRLAPELLAPDNNVTMRCYGRVMLAASAGVLDDDPRPLAQLHRPEMREHLQESFCTVLEAAARLASPALRTQMLVLATDWAASVGSLAEKRQEWLGELANARPARVPLGAYELDGELDKGAMGAVWLGEHTRLGQAVAVKFVLREALAHATAFEEEVELLATLDHPAVVQVLDVGEVSEATEAVSGGRLVAGTRYLVMEFVPGGTLTDHRGALAWEEVRDLVLALLDALAYVHARGILHRDLKPQNVLVGQSAQGLYVRLSDFGLAGAGMQHKVAGTPAYMAPEQFSGIGLGPWSDVYAVGCIATALLTGLPPFLGSAGQLARAHRSRPIPPLDAPVRVPDGFEDWRLRMLAKAPEDRFPTARAASLALRALPELAPEVVETPGRHRPVEESFVFETLVGLPIDEEVSLTPSRVGFRTLLPRQGFVQRPFRARLPTDRLFGRFPSPVIGQTAVRQALWDAATAAYREEAVHEIHVRVPLGMSLDRVLAWARHRLRELGVDASPDGSGDFQLSEQPTSRGPALVVRRDPTASLALARLDPMDAIAQLRVQVAVAPDLAWELARRAHGLPTLLDRLLEAVIRHPGLVPSDAGLVAGGPLPPRFPEEGVFWDAVLADLSDGERAAVERASLRPPGLDLDPSGVPADLCAGRRIAPGLAEHVQIRLTESGRAEAIHEGFLGSTDPLVQGWHQLGAGDPEGAELLLRSALPSPVAAEALQRCLDLLLVPADDPRRDTGPVVRSSPVDVEGVLARADGPGRGLSEALEALEDLLLAGLSEGRDALGAVVLAAVIDRDDVEWDTLVATCSAAWTPALAELAGRRAVTAHREDRLARVQVGRPPEG
ncbi:MAG: serine/threonine-protein kinase [Myxococcota bacterium]